MPIAFASSMTACLRVRPNHDVRVGKPQEQAEQAEQRPQDDSQAALVVHVMPHVPSKGGDAIPRLGSQEQSDQQEAAADPPRRQAEQVVEFVSQRSCPDQRRPADSSRRAARPSHARAPAGPAPTGRGFRTGQKTATR